MNSNSKNCNEDAMPAVASSRIVLEVRWIGPVPAMKNNKMLTRGRLITNPKRQEWMERCTEAFASQLLFGIPTGEQEILTAQRVRSWIASNMPANDSRQCMPELHIYSEDCVKGKEGATITIERL